MLVRSVLGAAVAAAVLTLGSVAQADTFRQITSKTEFVSTVVNRSLQLPLWGVDLRVTPDGRIQGQGAGRPVSGQWQWNGGYFCRDLFWGERNLGPNCQAVAVNGTRVRFTSDRGSGQSAEFRLR